MIGSFVTYMEVVLLPLGAWGVFLATFVEQVIVPIPSSFVQFGGGFFLIDTTSFSTAFWKILILVSIPSTIAITIVSVFIYYVSSRVGKPLIDKWGKFLGVKWQEIETLQQKLNASRGDEVFLLVLRSLPVMPTVAVDIFCGIIRYPLGKYIIITVIGTIIRGTFFGLLGWRLGKAYIEYASYVANIEKYLLFAIVIAFLIFIIIRTKKSKDL